MGMKSIRTWPPLVGLFLAALLALPVCEWMTVGPIGIQEFQDVELLVGLVLVVFLIATLVAPILMLDKKHRKNAIKLFLISGATTCLMIASIPLAGSVRMFAFSRMADRTEPLIRAIRAYENTHRVPPTTLDALVPNYIAVIPNTGLRAYPRYNYVSGEQAKDYDGNPWALYVDTSSGLGNWDIFLYLPRENYPRYGYGGGLERVGNWAYVHE